MNSYNVEKNRILSRRLVFIMLINVLAFAVLVGRLYYLQVYEAAKYKMMSEENRISSRFSLSPRGMIFDRNGEVIARNVQNFQAVLSPEQDGDVEKTLKMLKDIISISDEDEQRILREAQSSRRGVPVKLKDKLSWEEVARLSLYAPELPGVEINEGLSRHYPFGELYAHVVGYVGPVSENDKKSNSLYMVPGFKIGKSGLEKYFDGKLQGKSGVVKLEVNAFGRVMKEIERNAGHKGEDLYLTIDSRLQKAAFEAFGEQTGAAVVLDVNSGEVLAMVSLPSFDPNWFTNGISYEHWNALQTEKAPLLNKAVAGEYSPGSTYKIAVALAALEAETIDVSTRFYCGGAMNVGSSKFHCWHHGGHGSLNVVESIRYSCDIFFYETALRTGIEKIHDMSLKLGLGQYLNIGLEEEKKGLIPSRKWKKSAYDAQWTMGDSANTGIGQGYVLVTPLQLATMLARVVNGGYAVTPTFIRTAELQDKKSKRMDIATKNLELVKLGMFEVVNSGDGTARRARFNLDGARMGGKTGTTQVRRISLKERASGIISDSRLPWHLRNHAWFMGFAPADNPRYAVAVIAEHGSSGSAVAAPIAGKILQEALRLDIK